MRVAFQSVRPVPGDIVMSPANGRLGAVVSTPSGVAVMWSGQAARDPLGAVGVELFAITTNTLVLRPGGDNPAATSEYDPDDEF